MTPTARSMSSSEMESLRCWYAAFGAWPGPAAAGRARQMTARLAAV